MQILLGCEESGIVTECFRKLGHEAYSCDLLPTSGSHPEWHLKMDVLQAIKLKRWDMGIFFPDCTYIAGSGLHWNKRIPSRAEKTEQALQFVCDIINTAQRHGIKKIGLENPVGCISTRIFRYYDELTKHSSYRVFPRELKHGGLLPSQTIQPYQFGEDASKRTCLWLWDLPLLKPTKYIAPRIVDGKKRWANQTDSGQNKLGPSEDRAMIRAKTYKGIAEAMSSQWSFANQLF